MAEKKRQCGTCRFFAKSDSGLNGKCTHPKRDRAHLDLLLLRPNELGCRTRWGTSLWQDPADDRDPDVPAFPQQPTLPEPISAQLHYDDEVTSVSIAGSTTARSSFEDDVVDSGAVPSPMGSWSDSIQEERRRLLMNSSQEALAGARKRHMDKKTRQRELIPFADEVPDTKSVATNDISPSATEEPVTAREASFAPDDFVEDERSSDPDSLIDDDEMVDEGLSPGSARTPRGRRLMRETKSPKDHKAMVLGAPAEMTVTSHNPEKREKFYSVPIVTPGMELPFMAAAEKPAGSPSSLRMSASAAPMASSSYAASVRPMSQAREAMSEDRLRLERARRHVVAPLATGDSAETIATTNVSAVTNRPRLHHAMPDQAAPVEQLKTSPLRGYHPAVKAAAARKQRDDAHVSVPSRESHPNHTIRQTAPGETARQVQRAPAERVSGQPNRVDSMREALPNRQQLAERQTRPEPQRPRDTTPFTGSSIEIAPQVPRCCGTCASFRPSGVSGRGSCANEFAGPVQRVVNEQDLACQHTYGCFWLPADDEVWLDDLKQDYAATPRVDRMIARRTQRKTVVLPDLEELTS